MRQNGITTIIYNVVMPLCLTGLYIQLFNKLAIKLESICRIRDTQLSSNYY